MQQTQLLPQPARSRLIGASDLNVSSLAWGMWRFAGEDVAKAGRLVRTVLDSGITLLDTADIYGLDGAGFGAAETLLGRILQAEPGLRRRFVLASKGGIRPPTPYDSSARYLQEACHASLRRLQTDRIDLYQLHRPDSLAHPQETAQTLTALRDAGKIGFVGVSNYSVAQTRALQAFMPFPLVSQQPEFSALHIEPLSDGLLDHALETQMAVLAWSPLGGGRLSGEGSDARSRAVIAALDDIALREAVPRMAVALAWIMAHPSRPIPIVGSQTPDRVVEAVRALDVRLTREDWYSVLTASRQQRLP